MHGEIVKESYVTSTEEFKRIEQIARNEWILPSAETELIVVVTTDDEFADSVEIKLSIFDPSNLTSKFLGSFCIFDFPGNCGMAVVSGLRSSFQRKGIGTLLLGLAEKCVENMGYSCIMASDVVWGVGSLLLEHKGYACCREFNNARSGNNCNVYIKVLNSAVFNEDEGLW